METEKVLEDLLLLSPDQQARFFTLACARPALRVAMARSLKQPQSSGAVTQNMVEPSPPGSVADYRIVFDGGSKGNPGDGYGSYQVTALRTGKSKTERLTFGAQMTNNEAEYETLIGALQTLAKRIEKAGKSPLTYSLDIWGDSQLVIYQVLGKWKAKDPRMAAYRDQVRRLLQQYKGYTLRHHDRSKSVAALGH